MKDTVTILQTEYDRLKACEDILTVFYSHGLERWENYQQALDNWREASQREYQIV